MITYELQKVGYFASNNNNNDEDDDKKYDDNDNLKIVYICQTHVKLYILC